MTLGTAQAGAALSVGESMALIAPVQGGRLADGDPVRLASGGAEATVALYLAQLGHRVAWASYLGNDPLGERILRELRLGAVDTHLVRRHHSAPTGVYFKEIADGRTTVYYYRQGSAATHMSPAYLDTLLAEPAALLHLSGITPALSESCRALVDSLIPAAQQAGLTVSFDVNYRPGLWTAKAAGPVLLGLSSQADIVFVGRDEAATLWQAQSDDDIRHLIGARNTLIVKDAANGASLYDEHGKVHIPAEAVDGIVDVVGAGDAFAAGVLSAWLTGAPAAEGLTLGHRLAARTLRSPVDFVADGEPADAGPTRCGNQV